MQMSVCRGDIAVLHTYPGIHFDYVSLQWLVGNVVGRDDTLYARMKQRDLDGHDSMWEPIFVDDAAIGLGDQKNKVPEKAFYTATIHLHLKILVLIKTFLWPLGERKQ